MTKKQCDFLIEASGSMDSPGGKWEALVACILSLPFQETPWTSDAMTSLISFFN